jgi:sporulation protein YlmC with PRC-barrel domain
VQELAMKTLVKVALCAAAVIVPARSTRAQVAGAQTVGVTIEEMKLVLLGWSAKHELLGKEIYNDKNEKLGKIDDIIVAPTRTVSFAIIGVGGFLGIAKKDVAIPMDQIKQVNGKFVVAGATKAAVKAMPPFEYAKR